MPIDIYQCKKCGNQFQVFSRLWEVNREITCPACNSGELKRLDLDDTQESKNSGACKSYLDRESS